jgi:ABC-2 type transport system ATP-binding protein
MKNYSLGMKQRLALAGAILGDPEILILDEPANGLDPAGIAWLRNFLRKLAQGGRTILVSSHQLAELQNTVDDVIVIHKGRLIAQGTIEEVKGEGTLEEAFLKLTQGELS